MALLKSILTPDYVWNAVPDYDKPAPSPRRLERIARLEGSRHAEEAEHARINDHVRATWGGLSPQEPKSIHSPAPRPKIQRIGPPKRAQSVKHEGKQEVAVEVREPKKLHPAFPPQLKPYLSRFYEKD